MNNTASKKTTLRSGELARLAGVSTDTLRYYERKGLLAPERATNGYREYPSTALERVHLIRRAIAMGFRLEDLALVLQTRDRGGMPCHEVRALTGAKLKAVEAQIQELLQLRDTLQSLLKDWDVRLANTADGERAWLLENFVEGATIERAGSPRASTSCNEEKEQGSCNS